MLNRVTWILILSSTLCLWGRAASQTNPPPIVEIQCKPKFESEPKNEIELVLRETGRLAGTDVWTWLVLEEGQKRFRVFWASRVTPGAIELSKDTVYRFTVQTAGGRTNVVKIQEQSKVLYRKPSFADFTGLKAGEQYDVYFVRLCWCPPGKFTMGSPRNEPERRPGEDQVEVTISKGFWAGAYEVTQTQWHQVMGKFPGDLNAGIGDFYPVYSINFAEAEEFCRKLTDRMHASEDLPNDWEFRLPTEAQWEYACRAGTTTATAFGDKLSSKQANFQGKPYNGAEEGPSLKRAAPVCSYLPNAWGLYDMHGNEFEWCRDWYHAKLPGGVDPDLYAAKSSATPSEHGGISRVRRGGCWADDGWPCRSAFRLRFEPERRHEHIGFRVVAIRR